MTNKSILTTTLNTTVLTMTKKYKVTIANNGTPLSGPIDDISNDVYDFGAIHDWEPIKELEKVFDDVNITGAFVLSIIGLGIFITIADKRLREIPQMWHLFQIMLLSVLMGIILHPFGHFRTILYDNGLCEFVMYSAEYISFASPLLMVVFHVEVLFAKVIPLSRWQTREFSRFFILSLISWLCTSLLVAHVVLTFSTKEMFCLHIKSEAAWSTKFALREVLPMAICALCNMVMIAVSCFNTFRRNLRTESSGLHQVRFEDTGDVSEWIRSCLVLNVILLVRVVAMVLILKVTSPITLDKYRVVRLLHVFHAQSFYIVPICALFISGVRRSIADEFLKIAGLFRVSKGDDSLAVSFANISQTA
ncbi:hypothetical protein DPMN_060933 [Dreissena polymorpha]|uniref:Uncharacterized protein n=1 Tax=Dreissena polymorpha TaxID=45954 RepID=A0A9D4C6R1_DREPO|nr:hypothetical protein DPMN_060933 [Dreissena polymorpha]